MRTKLTREADIQSEVIHALKKMGIWAMRVNSGKVRVRGGWMQLAPEGTADILAARVLGGELEVYWLEVKNANGQQSEAQKQFQADVGRLGMSYYLVRSLDDLQKVLC